MIRMAPSRSKGLEMKNGAPKTVRTKRAAVTANGATATYNPTSAAVLPPITKPEIIQNGAQATTSKKKAHVHFSRSLSQRLIAVPYFAVFAETGIQGVKK